MNKLTVSGWPNRLLIATALAGVAGTYLIVQSGVLFEMPFSETTQFILRRIIRVALNDFFMMLFIMAWFKDWGITRVAIAIQLLDSLILLPLYLLVKIHFEGPSEISSPLFSQIHRIVVNPTLMILLIPAVYFQRMSRQ